MSDAGIYLYDANGTLYLAEPVAWRFTGADNVYTLRADKGSADTEYIYALQMVQAEGHPDESKGAEGDG